MKKYDLVLLTDFRYVNPEANDPYISNILHEDALLINALNEKGLKSIRVDWADKDFDWATTKYAIFRTTWDYFDRIEEFRDWLESTKDILHFINPREMILWNLDKHYLQDLSGKDVNIPPTIFIEPGEDCTLSSTLMESGWQDAILKPAISGAARHTYRVNANNADKHERIFQELIKEESMLLQPFQHSVVKRGEVALMYFNGVYSHAVLKIAKKGDFRVQDDFGGTVHDYQPTEEEIKLGNRAIIACDTLPVYARVDIIDDNEGKPAVTELELIEPELWLRHYPTAAINLAEAIIIYLAANKPS